MSKEICGSLLENEIENFSKNLFKNKTKGIIITLITNILYIYTIYKKIPFCSILIFILIAKILIKIPLNYLLENKKSNKILEDKTIEKISKIFTDIKKRINNVIIKASSLEDKYFSFTLGIILYALLIITKKVGDKFIIWFLFNIAALYYPIETKKHNFITNLFSVIQKKLEEGIKFIISYIPSYDKIESKIKKD